MAIVQEVAAPHLRALTLKTRTQNKEAIDEMKKEGIEVIVSSADVRKEFFVNGRAAWSDGVGKIYSQELLDRVKAVIESYQP